MCKAKNYAEDILTICESIINDLNDSFTEQSNLALEEQDLLHTIENVNFNACGGYKLAKLLKDVRVRRRDLKIEQETLIKLKKDFVDKSMNNLKCVLGNITKQNNILQGLKENKVYKPRILKSVDLKLVTSRKQSKDKNDYIGKSKVI